jgi:general secretion pathway protein D
VSSSNAGGSAISITAGTPQEFTTRNVGVELKVTPTVEEDDYSISLDLNPRVTEFEGFVEYGGQSVAIGGGTTVTVPSGFYQPIFSTREVTTKVTVWDGATLVMGGLTREEVKKTSDKVPVLGDIPLIGRAFRSKGESSSKRNLLIFVTANLVSPGGSPKKQQLKSVAASSTFQNPTIVTPGSAESRVRGGNAQ